MFYQDKGVYPLYISQQNNEQVLNVLLINNEEKSLYVFIKDFNSLVYQKSKHKGRKYFWMHCLQNFTTEEILNKHKSHCLLINGTQKSTFESRFTKFKNYDKQIPSPSKIYADIECFNKKINFKKGNNTTFYSKHIPYSVGAKLVCIDDKYMQPIKIFFRSNWINEFLQWVFKQKIKCNNIIKNHFNKPIIMTQADEENYNNTNTCWTCTQEISENKVRDHCHITGKFRGAAHKEWNSKLKIPKKLPVIFHNLEGYDGQFIFRELNNFTNINIDVIPKSTEKYMSFVINKNIFLDSLQSLKSTLDNLAANLEDSDRKYLLSFIFTR